MRQDDASNLELLQEQAEPPLSRIMSMDRGPFRDKMDGDPFEYEIIGDPCAEPEQVTFKVFKFSSKARPGYMKRHEKKLGRRILEKGKFIFPKKSKKYQRLGLAGKDSWEILRDKLGGAEAICDRVKEAEKKEKKKPDDATGGRTPEAGAEIATDTGKEKKAEKKAKKKPAASGPLPGSLKYWILNGKTGLKDHPLDVGSSAAAKAALQKAFKDIIAKNAKPAYYNTATLGHALYSLVGLNGRRDVPSGTSDSPFPSLALEAAMELIKKKYLSSSHNGALVQLMKRKRRKMSPEDKKLAGMSDMKKTPSYKQMSQFAQADSAKLDQYLDMSYFGQGLNESFTITPQQLNSIVLNELKSIGFIKEPQESTMKITAGKLKKIIQEELAVLNERKISYKQAADYKEKRKPRSVTVGGETRFIYTDGSGHTIVGLNAPSSIITYGAYEPEKLSAAEKELESMAAAVAEASIKQLRQIIREELEETNTYTFNMYYKDGKPRVVNAPGRNYEKARELAGSTFGAFFDPPGMDNDLDTDNDGEISVGELEAEIEDIKDDLEAGSEEILYDFQVRLFDPKTGKMAGKKERVDARDPAHAKEIVNSIQKQKGSGLEASSFIVNMDVPRD